MSSPLSTIPWEACLLEPAKDAVLEAHARRMMGSVHPGIRYFTRSPWLARAMVDWLPEHGLLTELDAHTADLISLIVSQENSCRYCYAAVRALLRIQGMSEARLERLEQQLLQLDVDPRLVAVARYARVLSRSNPALDAATARRLGEVGYGPAAVREIAFAVASTAMFNRINTIAATPPGHWEGLPEQWLVRGLRPLIARLIERNRQRHRGHVATAPAPISGPGAWLVGACRDSPIAALLARTLQDMWAGPALEPRSRLLIFAIVARGLGCERIEQETTQQLLAQGAPEDLLPQVLAHLDAPALTPLERRLVAFARETIWYEPSRLQQRARHLREGLSSEQFTEALGVMSLANGLCRFNLALQLADG